MTKTLIGHLPVDSGQIMLIDPCYAWDDDYKPGAKPTGLPYDEACRASLSPKHYGPIGGTVGGEAGISLSTLHGDGTYPVYAELDNRGRIIRVTIDFSDYDLENEYVEYYDEDDYDNEDDDDDE